jgi:hypothetical protein
MLQATPEELEAAGRVPSQPALKDEAKTEAHPHSENGNQLSWYLSCYIHALFRPRTSYIYIYLYIYISMETPLIDIYIYRHMHVGFG